MRTKNPRSKFHDSSRVKRQTTLLYTRASTRTLTAAAGPLPLPLPHPHPHEGYTADAQTAITRTASIELEAHFERSN